MFPLANILVKNSLAFFVVTAALGQVLQGKWLEWGAISAGGRNTREKEEAGENDDVIENRGG